MTLWNFICTILVALEKLQRMHHHYSSSQIEKIVNGFQNGTLPANEWTHEAHLIVALWYLNNYDLDEAICRFRPSLINYHSGQGGQHTLSSGYHETLTLFWLEVLNTFKEQPSIKNLNLSKQTEILLSGPVGDKKLPSKFYSKEHLMSVAARARWVTPDLKLFDLNDVLDG